jgi:uncharacterized protein YdhG (YjbR/CyaY superfamily)
VVFGSDRMVWPGARVLLVDRAAMPSECSRRPRPRIPPSPLLDGAGPDGPVRGTVKERYFFRRGAGPGRALFTAVLRRVAKSEALPGESAGPGPVSSTGASARTATLQGGRVHAMTNRKSLSSVDEYVAGFPPETRRVLEELRALIRTAAPEATETISYAIPTFDLNGHLVHFAGYAKHVGFYPTGTGIAAFREELAPYRTGKGSVQFPLGEPLPSDLIRRIVEFRVEENGGATGKRP